LGRSKEGRQHALTVQSDWSVHLALLVAQANRICLGRRLLARENTDARAVAPFHLTSELSEAAENAEKNRICPIVAAT